MIRFPAFDDGAILRVGYAWDTWTRNGIRYRAGIHTDNIIAITADNTRAIWDGSAWHTLTETSPGIWMPLATP